MRRTTGRWNTPTLLIRIRDVGVGMTPFSSARINGQQLVPSAAAHTLSRRKRNARSEPDENSFERRSEGAQPR
jgi:hypothetical protein